MRGWLVAALAVVLVGTGCGGSTSETPSASVTPEVHVVGATVTLGAKDQAILGFSAHNAGSTPDRLVAAVCACADAARLVGSGTIEPQVTGMFGPEGDHVILRGVHDDVRPGDFVQVTLTFDQAGETSTQAEVVAADG
jgi:copper(I)-binding protein